MIHYRFENSGGQNNCFINSVLNVYLRVPCLRDELIRLAETSNDELLRTQNSKLAFFESDIKMLSSCDFGFKTTKYFWYIYVVNMGNTIAYIIVEIRNF